MKKVFFIAATVALLGCEHPEIQRDLLADLTFDLDLCASTTSLKGTDQSARSLINPYDSWGEYLIIGMKGTIDFYSKSELRNIPPPLVLSKMLPKEITDCNLSIDDLKNVNLVIDKFLSLFIEKEINLANQVSIEMEKMILASNALSEKEKDLVFQVVSILRHTTYYFSLIGQKGDYEDCWREKLQSVQDSGIFTKLACVFNWPVCLGALALDCLVEQIV